jgi:hypothetical protein
MGYAVKALRLAANLLIWFPKGSAMPNQQEFTELLQRNLPPEPLRP